MTHPPAATAVTLSLPDQEITFETGRIARQASGAVVARRGDDVVLATVVVADRPRAGADFFPLTVEYREKLAAAGRIPGSFNRREGRVTDHEILVCRIIDRSIRSLFPDGYRNEVQIQATVLSSAPGADVPSLALLAATCALHLSAAPARGPAAGLRIARCQQQWIALPTAHQRADADLDLVVSAGPDGLVMVEGSAREASEADTVQALEQGLTWAAACRDTFEQLRQRATEAHIPRPKQDVRPPDELPELPPTFTAHLERAIELTAKGERRQAIRDLEAAHLAESPADTADRTRAAMERAKYTITRNRILDGIRPDGRGPRDIRPIGSEVGWLPRAHGSALFTRGETQAIVTCTLGPRDAALKVDSLDGLAVEPFLLHYNFPPYSVGEARPLRGPGRREIGHGALARRGVAAVLPDMAAYPYAVRVESEISESNGSSSMATVCGASLALMDAGVPLTRPVAGIAMGLVTDGDRTAILSDILGDEDHLGDMDFKVVGTELGITALQLDNKVGGLPFATLAQALDQAREGRLHILAAMATTLAQPAAAVSAHAPQVMRTAILPSSIGALVGQKGANIRHIQDTTGAKISIADDGAITVYAADRDAGQQALGMIHESAGILEVGTVYEGTVTGVKDFGAFVRVNGVNEGLVPRDELGGDKGQHPDELVKAGDRIQVEVLGADDRGRLRLSHRRALR